MFSDSLYHKYIVILQSSGTGKTRLISGFAEQRKMHLVYACYRALGSTGFPLSVISFYDSLIDIFDSDAVEKGMLNPIHAFSSVLLHVIQLVLEDNTAQYRNGISKKSEMYENVWRTAFRNAQNTAFAAFPDSFCVNATHDIEPNDTFRFFLVFDEASWMLKHTISIKSSFWYPNGRDSASKVEVTLFRVLRRAFNFISIVLRKFGILPIFIDTNSAVSNFAPSPADDLSDRGSEKLQIIPPFFQTNAVPTAYNHESPFLFGRPLWGAMYSHHKQNPGDHPAEFDTITLASQKLKCKPKEFGVWSASVFSCLLDLDINAGARLPEHMMRSFMVRPIAHLVCVVL